MKMKKHTNFVATPRHKKHFFFGTPRTEREDQGGRYGNIGGGKHLGGIMKPLVQLIEKHILIPERGIMKNMSDN